MKYDVDFEYNIPEWATVQVEAENKDEAEELARDEFDMMFPEAIEPTVIEVSVIHE